MHGSEAPFFNSKDSMLTTNTEEINFSDVGGYAGLAFIVCKETGKQAR